MLPRIVYILTQGHSGSTLLDLIISSHPNIASVGELRFMGNRLDLGQPCTCGSTTIKQCQYWTGVDHRLRVNGECLGTMNINSDDREEFKRVNIKFFDAVAKATSCEIIVDSTKSVGRLRKLANIKDLNVLVVLLVRNPTAVVASNIRRGRPWLRYALGHLVNMASKTALATKFPSVKVHYEALVTSPQAELIRVMNPLGLSFVDDQLHWNKQEHHLLGGNPMRFDKDSRLQLDERWKRELGVLQKLSIQTLINPVTMWVMQWIIQTKRVLQHKV